MNNTLLFISSYPFPRDKGSNQHAYYFLKALCADFRVHGFFFIQPGHGLPSDIDAPLAELGMKDHTIGHFSKPPQRTRFMGALHRLRAFPSPYMQLAVNPANLAEIEGVIRRNAVDAVHIEHFHYAKYAQLIRSPVKKAIVYHDLHHTIFWQRARSETNLRRRLFLLIDGWKYGLFQRRLDAHVDLKVFLNAEEMAHLPRKAVHVPHVVDQAIVYRPPRRTGELNLLFMGAFKHPPNVTSVAWILDNVLPRLSAHACRFRLHLVGSGADEFQSMVDRTRYAGSVTVHGFVSDINQAFEEMDVALFPIVYGGGIKTKIIDAMAAGVPVVTTPPGVHGMNGQARDCIGVGTTPDEVVDQVRALMDSFELRRQRSRDGRRYVRETHAYDIFAQRIRQTYQRLCTAGGSNG